MNKDKREIKMDKLYTVKALCSECGNFLMESNQKTEKELHDDWVTLIASAPLNAPKCNKCGYSTERDCNAGLNFKIKIIETDEEEGVENVTEITPDEFFKK